MYRILVAGERPEEAKSLAFQLGFFGHEVTPSAIDEALIVRSLLSVRPDLLILSVHSAAARPVVRLLSQVADLPVLVLLAAELRDDLPWFLEQGAADCVTVPVSPAIVSARIFTILRRAIHERNDGEAPITIGPLIIDPRLHVVRHYGRTIPLTPTEFRLLHILARNKGRPCSHRMLLSEVWGQDYAHCSHYLRLYIGYLRQKLEENPRNPKLLQTQWGIGYRLAVPAAPGVSSAEAVQPEALSA